MNYSFYILILFINSVLSQQEHIPSQHAGIIINIGQEFFYKYKQEAVQHFVDNLAPKTFPNVSRQGEVAFGVNVLVELSSISVVNFTFNPNLTDIKLSKEEPNFHIDIDKMGFKLSFDYKIKTDPELVDEVGSGTGVVKDLTMNLKASPRMRDGKFQLQIDYLELDFPVFNLTLEGEDMAMILNSLSQFIINIIKESLVGVLQDQSVASIEEVINMHIYKQRPDADFPDYGVELDVSLVGDGVHVTDQWIAIPLDGTFCPEMYEEDFPKKFVKMPLYKEEGKNIQVMISEYTLTTLLKAAIELQWYNYTSIQSSDNVDAMINDFEFAFGEHEKCEMFVKPILEFDGQQTFVKISEEGSTIDLVVEIHYRNPLNPSIDVALIIAKLVAEMRFFVRDDFKLYGSVENVQLKALDFEPYFVTTTSTKQISSKISLLGPFMGSYANNILDQGIQMPVQEQVSKHIKNPTVLLFDKYLMIDGEADFDDQEEIEVEQEVLQREGLREKILRKGKNSVAA